MKKINPLFISGCLLLVAPAMSATLSGTLEPTVVPLTNGGQANIAVSNTDPNLFTVPGDRITAINSLDGGLTNQEQTDSGGAILATVSKKPFTFIVETENNKSGVRNDMRLQDLRYGDGFLRVAGAAMTAP